MNNFDYIIIGAGASGLLLADALGKDAFFKDKQILLLDKDAKKTNDRTWCFWEKGAGQFDEIVHQQWKKIYFGGPQFSKTFEIAPYTYKMLRGIDFYEHYFNRIKTYSNITFRQETVTTVIEEDAVVSVTTSNSKYTAKKAFNSIFDYKMASNQTKYPVLQQHFIGWFIKADTPIFKKDEATFMDFSVPQKGNTRFMYVLPFSETEGLVEYTLFSQHRLPDEEYEEAIKAYLKNTLHCASFEITDTEKGSIPMTCYHFWERNTKDIMHIGMAGGWAKASTGYTFMSSAKKVPKIIGFLKSGKPFSELNLKNKFWYYDLLFLDVLYQRNDMGHEVFQSLFKKRKPQEIFGFLGEESTLWQDVKIMSGPKPLPFIKALLKRLFRPFFS
ncbi:MAG: lycopene cyclase family protein [Maribacter sp.]